MKNEVKFSFRGAKCDIERIDQTAARHGFKTRTKYLMHAGLHYEDGINDDDLMGHLARLVYSIRQIERASADLPFLIKQNDVMHIRRDVRRTMAWVLDRLS